jgi:hypothetical protein
MGHRLKLADFGSALQLKKPAAVKRWFFTEPYTAPECFAGVYTPAADMWSIGIILHVMAAGRLPFAERPKDGSYCVELPPATPKELCELVRSMLLFSHTDRLNVLELHRNSWSRPVEDAPPATVDVDLADAMQTEHNRTAPHDCLSMYRHADRHKPALPSHIALSMLYRATDDFAETASCLHFFLQRMQSTSLPLDNNETSHAKLMRDELVQLWLAFSTARTLMLSTSVNTRRAIGMFMLHVAQPALYRLCPALDNAHECNLELYNCVRNVATLLSFFGACAAEWSLVDRPLPPAHPADYLVSYCNELFCIAKTQTDAQEAQRLQSWPFELMMLLLAWNPALKHGMFN